MYSGEMVEERHDGGAVPHARGTLIRRVLSTAFPISAADKRSRTLAAIPGHIPLPQERPQGCLFAPRCSGFVAGRCDQPGLPMLAAGPDHRCAACAGTSISAPAAGAAESRPLGQRRSRRPTSKPSDVTKRYPLGYRRTLTANEAVSFDVGEARSWRWSASPAAASRPCPHRRRARPRRRRATSGWPAKISPSARPERGRATCCSHVQMIFQNPDTTLNPSHSADFSIRRAIKKFGIRKGKAAVEQRLARAAGDGAAVAGHRRSQAEPAVGRPEAAHRALPAPLPPIRR